MSWVDLCPYSALPFWCWSCPEDEAPCEYKKKLRAKKNRKKITDKNIKEKKK